MTKHSNFPHIVKSDIIDNIAKQKPEIPFKEITYAVSTIIEILSSSIASGKRIEIRGFGSFKLKKHPPRQSRNPKTGEQIAAFEKWRPHFKPGKKLKEAVDEFSK